MGGSPVDVSLVIRQQLEELGLEQRDLARAAQVTESYSSQLMTQKKLPPAPERTDMYDKMGKLLKLPGGELAKLAHLQRREQLRKKLGDPPSPLFKEVRELILGKCNPDKQTEVRAILRSSPSANSNASSLRNCWMSSRALPNKNWKMNLGSAGSLDSATKAMNRYGSSCSSSWIRISLVCRVKTASLSLIRSLNPGTLTSRLLRWKLS